MKIEKMALDVERLIKIMVQIKSSIDLRHIDAPPENPTPTNRTHELPTDEVTSRRCPVPQVSTRENPPSYTESVSSRRTRRV